MSAIVERIAHHLSEVESQRLRRERIVGLSVKVSAVKHYQHQRFSLTYLDLLSTERYGAACRFFLDEIYGPRDFSARDAQFARVVPAIARLFPEQILQTVAALAELHALSESLDTMMAEHLEVPSVDAIGYATAWQLTGRAADRDQQIDLILRLGRSLDDFTRKPLLRSSLRMMRRPARFSGLHELQLLLESGFDAFALMRGAQQFLSIVESRERFLSMSLFSLALSGSGFKPDLAWLRLP